MKTIKELLSDMRFIIGLILTIILLLTWPMRDLFPTSKYKVGDCAAEITEEATEFTPAVIDYRYSYKILQVGKKQYKVSLIGDYRPAILVVNMSPFDRASVKIPCKDAK